MDHFLRTDVQERGAPVVHHCELRLGSPLLRGPFKAEDGRPVEAHPRILQNVCSCSAASANVLSRCSRLSMVIVRGVGVIACTSFPWTQPLMTIAVTRHPTRERARVFASGVSLLGA